MMSLRSVMCFCAVFGLINASAIPMWEFLSKEEKVSYIYSLFANQVENYCESSNVENCTHQLLKYGLGQLKKMSEEQLDAMDPYQRGASNIIWESLLVGHALMKTTPKPRSTTTAKPNSYDDESFGEDFGSEEAASAKIDNIYVVKPPRDFVYKLESGKPQYTYPQNVVSFIGFYNNPTKFQGKGVYTRFQEQYHPIRVTTEKIIRQDQYGNSGEENIPLTGPVVVRVYPDGTPVRETTNIPQDEDLKQHQMTKVKIPNL